MVYVLQPFILINCQRFFIPGLLTTVLGYAQWRANKHFRFLSVVKIAKKTKLFGSAQTQPLCIADVAISLFSESN